MIGNGDSQAEDRDDVLNIGGFSDAIFEILQAFAQGDLLGKNWVETIEGFSPKMGKM